MKKIYMKPALELTPVEMVYQLCSNSHGTQETPTTIKADFGKETEQGGLYENEGNGGNIWNIPGDNGVINAQSKRNLWDDDDFDD